MNDPQDNDSARLPPLGGEGGAREPRKPRIEVLRTEPARTAAAPVMAPPAAAQPVPRQPFAPQPAAPAAVSARRSGGLLSSPAALVALLGLAVLIAAIWYTASQGDSGPAPFDVGDAGSGSTQAAPAAPAADEAEPDLMFAEEQPADVPPAAAPPAAADAPPAAEPDAAPEPRAVRAVPPETAPGPVRDTAPAEAGSALATARAFYGALSAGDGGSAAQMVVPEKRGSGPLSAAALTRYYSSFRRPLRVRSMTPVDDDTVRVAYDYVLADGRVCRGAASVNVVRSGERSLVSAIRTAGPC